MQGSLEENNLQKNLQAVVLCLFVRLSMQQSQLVTAIFCSGFGCRVLFSSDQSFPLASAFAYSVYQFQSKRVKRDPDGPFFGGNAIVGAIFSTLCCLAVACAVSSTQLLSLPLSL